MNGRLIRVLAATLGAAIFMSAGPARSAEITMMASGAVREALLELLPRFESASGHKVVVTWAGTADIVKRMNAGESADLVVLAANSLDELIRVGKIVPGSRADVATSGVGVAVRAGAPKPDISSGDGLKRALLLARTIAYSGGPSGAYIAGLIQRMGIAEQVKPKIIQPPSGVLVGDVVARGDAEIGFQQVSELVHVTGIDYLGPLPPDIQNVTVFSSGIHTAARQPIAARELVRFLTSPDVAPVLRKHGMEPG